MPSQQDEQPFLVRFYDSNIKAKDAKGRTLTSITSWNDDQLEYHHDYIQLLFPLPEGSPFNPSAPVIDRTTFDAFRSRNDLKHYLRTALNRILRFYGFDFSHNLSHNPGHEPSPPDYKVVKAPNFDRASRNWVRKFNHNHLRITRILRSLRVLGLEREAKGFFEALKGVFEGGRISEKSMMFWTRAVERPLFLAPEDEEDVGEGAEFLYEFEESREEIGSIGELDGGEEGVEAAMEGTAPAINGEVSAEVVSKEEL